MGYKLAPGVSIQGIQLPMLQAVESVVSVFGKMCKKTVIVNGTETLKGLYPFGFALGFSLDGFSNERIEDSVLFIQSDLDSKSRFSFTVSIEGFGSGKVPALQVKYCRATDFIRQLPKLYETNLSF